MKQQELPWKLTESDPARIGDGANRALFFLGNGHLGLPSYRDGGWRERGLYLNGFYESAPYIYGETAYGYAKERQVMIPVADTGGWELLLNGAPVYPGGEGELLGAEEVLELRTGIRRRTLILIHPATGRLEITLEAICSFTTPELLGFRWTATLPADSPPLSMQWRVSPPVYSPCKSGDPRKGEGFTHNVIGRRGGTLRSDGSGELWEATSNSGLVYGCSFVASGATKGGEVTWGEGGFSVSVALRPGEKTTSEFYAAYSYASTQEGSEETVLDSTRSILGRVAKGGWETLCRNQEEHLKRFWRVADTSFSRDPELTLGIRYGLFAMLQSTREGVALGVAAKGLSSNGYNGHIFWDSDVFVQTAWATLCPNLARGCLSYRIEHRKEAKARAEELSEKGILFPWRTINGNEGSAYFLAGTAQYHINSDIVWGVREYIRLTGDETILDAGGLELVREIARFWTGFGVIVRDKGYCFHGVTGPDEYTAMVDNNFYTNLMARMTLSYAASLGGAETASGEVATWEGLASKIYLPRAESGEAQGINLQHDNFMEHAPWDWSTTPPEKRPLLLHYHPLNIYRKRVLKQPDVLMAAALCPEQWTGEQLERDFHFYRPLTTEDSSLSLSIHGILAARCGELAMASDYLRRNALIDLDDLVGNTSDGVHMASIAGSRLCLIYGFLGLRAGEEQLSLDPKIPEEWGVFRCTLVFRGRTIALEAYAQQLKLTLSDGPPFTLSISGVELLLEDTLTTPL